MKHDEKKFNSAVEEYKKILGDVKEKSFFVIFDINDEKSFYSLAPLSRAIHDLGADMNATGINKESPAVDALKDVYATYKDLKDDKNNEKTKALNDLIEEVDKKMKGSFRKLFEGPDFILEAKEGSFQGSFELPFKPDWFVQNRQSELDETCEILWRDVYNLQKDEKVSIGFSLIPDDKLLGHPLWHYLDSYAIGRSMMMAINNGRKLSMGAYTVRDSMLAKSEKVSELRATLLGLELCKEANEEIFRKFKKVSELLNLNRFEAIDASFFIAGKLMDFNTNTMAEPVGKKL